MAGLDEHSMSNPRNMKRNVPHLSFKKILIQMDFEGKKLLFKEKLQQTWHL